MTGDGPGAAAPRATPILIGHGGAEAALLGAWRSGRLPHAWLITGPRGIGKATLAYRFARFVLARGRGQGAAVPDSLHVDPTDPTFRRVAAASHADLLTVERSTGEAAGRPRRSEIVVEDARAVAEFLHLTPAEGGWRVVVIDTADDMNRHAANAVLKVVEEPPARALVLLVSHAPSRLLPTLRSRCRRLALRPLTEDEVMRVLALQRPEMSDEDRRTLARLGDGSPGRALELAEAGGLALHGDLMALLATLPSLDVVAAHALAERLARPGAEAAYRAVTELLVQCLADLVRAGAGAPPRLEWAGGKGGGTLAERLAPQRHLDRWVELWEKTTRLFRQAESVRLERKQVLLTAFLQLEVTARA